MPLYCVHMKNKKRKSDPDMQSKYSRAYILRLWREDQPYPTGFRASLEDPQTGERFGFASLELLFVHLMELNESAGNLQPGTDSQ